MSRMLSNEGIFNNSPATNTLTVRTTATVGALSAGTGTFSGLLTTNALTASGLSTLANANVSGDISMTNGRALVWGTTSGVAVGPMVEKRYNLAENRYGMGEFASVGMRMYAPSLATTRLSVATGAATYTDILTASSSGVSVTGTLTASGVVTLNSGMSVNPSTQVSWGLGTLRNNMLQLYGGGNLDGTDVYGLGVNAFTMRYNAQTGASHVMYANNVETFRSNVLTTVVTGNFTTSGNVTVANNRNMSFSNAVRNNILTLFGTTGLDDTNVYGLGVNSGALRYNATTGGAHVWYVSNVETLRSNVMGTVVTGNASVTRGIAMSDGSTTGGGGIIFANTAYRGALVESRGSSVDRYGLGMYSATDFVSRVYASGSQSTSKISLCFPAGESAFLDALVVTRDSGNATSVTSNVGINIASPATALHVVGNVRVDGSFLASGDVAAFSDRRLKDNLVVIQSGLSKLERLAGYTYDRTDMPGRFAGLVAQEVQAVLPEAVAQTPGGTLAVSATSVLALVVEAVKDLSLQVAKVSGALQQALGRIDALEASLAAHVNATT